MHVVVLIKLSVKVGETEPSLPKSASLSCSVVASFS